MKKSANTLEFKFERTIPAPQSDVFDGWLDPKTPGNPWNMAGKLLFHPEVDGLFYSDLQGTAHYGRFTALERPARLQHTWVSPNTLGQETTVTVTFQNKGEATLMTLVHSGLPDSDEGRSHEKGWNYFLGIFPEQFGDAQGKKR